MRVQRHSSRKNDEEHHHVRQKRDDANVHAPIARLFTCRPLALHEKPPAHGLFFFYLLRRLPKEKIRADRGSEYCDQGFPSFLAAGYGGDESVMCNLRPVRTHEEGHNYV